jgi:hypothetical protein
MARQDDVLQSHMAAGSLNGTPLPSPKKAGQWIGINFSHQIAAAVAR